jgi:coenzyme F420-reducing hydrogenase alpha subunit
MHGEILDSHILHAYMLVAPDFLGVGSVIPLAQTAPDVVLRALRMKKVSGDLCAAIAGRHTHPIAMTVGGFTHFPREDELLALRERLVAIREDNKATIELFASLDFPDFVRETEYIALSDGQEYKYIDGEIASTDGVRKPISEYRTVTNEVIVPHSSAKHTAHLRDSYMVGALARFNVNFEQLHPKARAAADALGLEPKLINPYLNTAAQVVEIVHCTEDAIEIIDTLVERGIFWEDPVEPTRDYGTGTGGVEVPRGVLFHEYTIEDGKIIGANCVIPTGQNLGNIDRDMRKLVPEILDRPKQEITHSLEMLVRAYDPCISCSTHILDVKFVNDDE